MKWSHFSYKKISRNVIYVVPLHNFLVYDTVTLLRNKYNTIYIIYMLQYFLLMHFDVMKAKFITTTLRCLGNEETTFRASFLVLSILPGASKKWNNKTTSPL